MTIVKRFSPMRKKGTNYFLTVVTDRNKIAKIPDGYERCGRSFLGNWDSDKPFPHNFIIQGKGDKR